MAKYHHRSDQEWFELITECRQSGMSDTTWCYMHHVPRSSFSTACKRLAAKNYAIAESNISDNTVDFTSKQEVVPVSIIKNKVSQPESTAIQYDSMNLDNSHTIDIQLGDALIRLSNNADPTLVRVIMHSLMGGSSYVG